MKPGAKPGVAKKNRPIGRIHPLLRQIFREQDFQRITDDHLAKKTGWSASVLSRWRRRNRVPSFFAFIDIAEALGFEVQLVRKDQPSGAQDGQE